jgi:hypothetical protein
MCTEWHWAGGARRGATEAARTLHDGPRRTGKQIQLLTYTNIARVALVGLSYFLRT